MEFWTFKHSDFGFVSDFDIRISDLFFEITYLKKHIND